MFMALFVVYGFDTAGTFGEETIDASRQAPRGILSAIWVSGIIGAMFLLAVHPRDSGHRTAIAQQDSGVPIATAIRDLPDSSASTFGELYLWVILVAVFVCTMAIQGATARLMFSMGRDRRMPLGAAGDTSTACSGRRPTRPSPSG